MLLLIEVAEASLRYEREVKIPLYARHGIPAVWLIDLTGRELTACQQPAGDGYLQKRVVTDLAAVALPGLSDLTIDLSALFGRASSARPSSWSGKKHAGTAPPRP